MSESSAHSRWQRFRTYKNTDLTVSEVGFGGTDLYLSSRDKQSMTVLPIALLTEEEKASQAKN